MPRSNPRRHCARAASAAPRRLALAVTEPLERRLCLSAAAFLPPVSAAAGVPATSVATGDFNNDSSEDVALAGSGGIYVLPGKGDGTFGSPVQVSTDTGAVKIVAQDFNGDGNLDLVAANPADGTITLLPGIGDGTFGPPTTIAAVTGVDALVFGQFNNNSDYSGAGSGGDGGAGSGGDGGVGSGGATGVPVPATGVSTTAAAVAQPGPIASPVPSVYYSYDDILVAGTGGLAVLTANGDGTYAAPHVIHAGSYQSVAVDDFNGDGNDDIAATTGGQVQVFSGNGDGTFAAPKSYAVGADATTIVTGDFNGDYNDDIAVASPGGGTVAVLFAQTDADGNATGAFAAPVSLAVGGTPRTVAAGDLNGDGNTDLVAATSTGVVVLTGNGDGTFAAPATFGGGLNAADVALDDFNGDGFLDLASAGPAGGPAGGVDVQLQSVPDVGVTLSAPTSSAIHGDLTYSVTVTNTGPTEADGVSLSDYLPTGVTLVSAAASQGTVTTTNAAGAVSRLGNASAKDVTFLGADGEVDVDLGNLAGGASATITVVVKPQSYGLISNSVTVSSASPDGNWDNNYAEADTQIVGTSGAEVGITQTATGGGIYLPIDRPIATPVTRVTSKPVAVAGAGAASAGTTSTGAASSGATSAGAGPVATSTAAPVATTTAAVASTPTSGVVSSGGASASGTGGVVVDPITPVIPIDPVPPIWWGGFIKVGDDVTYTLTVTNNGPETATAVTVNDTLPQNTSLVSATPGVGTADTSTAGAVNVALGDLASGASATITLVVKTQQVGTIDNTAAVASATADPYPDNNSSSVSRYVTDDTSPPYPEPLAGPIAYSNGGALYAAGAGTVASTTSASGTAVGGSTGAAGGAQAVAAPLPANAAATSDAPCQISIGDVKVKTAAGGTKSAVFTVTRKGKTKASASVHFATADATARAGSDYVPGAGVLTFAPGVKKLKVSIPIKASAAPASNKTFTVNLSSATDAAIARPAATATIVHPAKVSAKTAPVHVNFQPASAATPSGYLADTGAVFGPHAGGLSYGWSTDHTSTAALRSGPTGQPGSTYNVLHSGDKWEIAVPNGKYQVRVEAGGKVDAEGVLVVSGKPTAARPFAVGTRTITVSDGRLTLTDAAGSADVNLALVDLTRIGAAKGHKGGK